jgi:hypothetical protein
VSVSRHTSLQTVRPAPQLTWQAPREHTCPEGQRVPQAPQLPLSVCRSRQVPLHSEKPAVHDTLQLPPEHTRPEEQATPQAPQLVLSLSRSRQEPPQSTVPPAQTSTQRPLAHTSPLAQAMPQAPQLSRSNCRSRQLPPQFMKPAAQLTVQRPATHTRPSMHAVSQVPQPSRSVCRSRQVPLQLFCPAGQVTVQAPATQASPTLHEVPQVPQLRRSESRSWQVAPQTICPGGHDTRQIPDSQACPGGHWLLQPPQLSRSVRVFAQNAPAPASTPASPPALMQRARVGPHSRAQRPAAHTSPAPQGAPQAPQLRRSVCRSEQRPPQRLCPGGHEKVHRPALQIWVSGQAPPQAPQLARSLIVSTQRPPQSVVAPSQVTTTSTASTTVLSIAPSALPVGPTMLALEQAATSATIIQENCLITRGPRRSQEGIGAGSGLSSKIPRAVAAPCGDARSWHHRAPLVRVGARGDEGRNGMKFTLGSLGPHTGVDLLAVMLSEEDLARSPLLDALDSALGGAVRTAIADEEFTAKKDSALTVVTYGRATPRKILLLGVGPDAKVTPVELRAAGARAARTANAEKAKRVVFVGKGLTFDAGGLCIKPAASMGDMKCDMAGAAVTIGIVVAAARMGLPIEVHGVIGTTENLLGASAFRPSDVYTSREGKTVEIINTDAEGRLVLADILHWATELEPDYLIDHATLTGACMVALGSTGRGSTATTTSSPRATWARPRPAASSTGACRSTPT